MISHSEAVRVTFLMATALLCSYILGHFINTARIKNCPQSTAAILVGVVLALCLGWFPGARENFVFSFHPQFFYFFLLPPIILEAGFSLDRPNFLKNIWPILWFAVIGTVFSAVIVAEGIYLVADKIGLVGTDAEIRANAWLFGVLLSAVDPVATLGILGGSRFEADEKLLSLVFGESILNDAVAIVLFKTVENVVLNASSPTMVSGATITMKVFMSFLLVTLISCVIGCATAAIAYLAFKISSGLRKFPEYELGLMILLAYFSFALTESISGSGILSLFITGSLLGHYNLRNLSPSSQRSSALLFKVLAVLSESFIYVLFGVEVTLSITTEEVSYSPAFIAVTFGLMMLGRALIVFPTAGVLNFLTNSAETSRAEEIGNTIAARESLHNMLAKGATSVYQSATPLARSFNISPTAGETMPTEMDVGADKLLKPEEVIEEESFLSRQSNVHGRIREKLQLLLMDVPSPANTMRSDIEYCEDAHGTTRNSPPGNPRPQAATAADTESIGTTSALRVPLELKNLVFTRNSHDAVYISLASQRMNEYLANLKQHAAAPKLTSIESLTLNDCDRLPIEKNVEYLTFSCQIILWLSGLRGAVAFVLALSLPTTGTENSQKNTKLLVTTTLAVVLLTTILLGTCIELFARHSGVVKHIESVSSISPMHSDDRFKFKRGAGLLQPRKSFETWFYNPDSPLLGGGHNNVHINHHHHHHHHAPIPAANNASLEFNEDISPRDPQQLRSVVLGCHTRKHIHPHQLHKRGSVNHGHDDVTSDLLANPPSENKPALTISMHVPN